MKKLFFIALSTAATLLTACNTGSFAYYDDIYSSSSDDQYKIMQAKNRPIIIIMTIITTIITRLAYAVSTPMSIAAGGIMTLISPTCIGMIIVHPIGA